MAYVASFQLTKDFFHNCVLTNGNVFAILESILLSAFVEVKLSLVGICDTGSLSKAAAPEIFSISLALSNVECCSRLNWKVLAPYWALTISMYISSNELEIIT
jgi:hypothetical protein